MIDMFDRIPGPAHWAVWIVLLAQLATAALAIGSLASAAGVFISSMIPVSPKVGGWLVTIFAVSVVWSGGFNILKTVMSVFVVVIVLGVLYVAVQVFPSVDEFLQGMIPQAATVPDWAVDLGVDKNPWTEILPLLGWSAGGFASQVWYTYWVMGAGYGAAQGVGYGHRADASMLQRLTRLDAERLKGWCRVVYADATLAMVIGTVVTISFLIAGAAVLGAAQMAPEGPDVALELSRLFSSRWGSVGGFLFILGGTAALISTQIGQLAGWPRLLADAFRICIPGFGKRFAWKSQFRIFLVIFLITNMVIVFTLG